MWGESEDLHMHVLKKKHQTVQISETSAALEVVKNIKCQP